MMTMEVISRLKIGFVMGWGSKVKKTGSSLPAHTALSETYLAKFKLKAVFKVLMGQEVLRMAHKG